MYGLPTRTGKLKGLEYFDSNFFGVHAKQADVMDPQLRLLLESTYECIVDAGKIIVFFLFNMYYLFKNKPHKLLNII